MNYKLNFKGLDDAISDQNDIINRTINMFDRFIRNIEYEMRRMEDTPVNEVQIDFSDQSPFKTLTKEQLKDKKFIEDLWSKFPKFMYLSSEIETFKKEYEQILANAILDSKTFIKKSLIGVKGYIDKLPDDVKNKEDAETTTKFVQRIQKTFNKKDVQLDQFLAGLNHIKTLKGLSEALEKAIQQLKQ